MGDTPSWELLLLSRVRGKNARVGRWQRRWGCDLGGEVTKHSTTNVTVFSWSLIHLQRRFSSVSCPTSSCAIKNTSPLRYLGISQGIPKETAWVGYLYIYTSYRYMTISWLPNSCSWLARQVQNQLGKWELLSLSWSFRPQAKFPPQENLSSAVKAFPLTRPDLLNLLRWPPLHPSALTIGANHTYNHICSHTQADKIVFNWIAMVLWFVQATITQYHKLGGL